MLVSKNTKICITPDANNKICVVPNAKSQCEPMEYRLHWEFTFHVVCAHFIRVGYPTGTQFAVEYGLKSVFIVCSLPYDLPRIVECIFHFHLEFKSFNPRAHYNWF